MLVKFSPHKQIFLLIVLYGSDLGFLPTLTIRRFGSHVRTDSSYNVGEKGGQVGEDEYSS